MNDWEELTAPPPEKVTNAANEIKWACELMNSAGDKLVKAMDFVSGEAVENRIGAFLNELEDLRIDLNRLKEKMEGGKV